MHVDPNGEHPILVVIQYIILPILVYFAKKYMQRLFGNSIKRLIKSKLAPLIKKHLKNYSVSFFKGEAIFKIVKKKKGRLFSFDYGDIPYADGKKQKRIKSFHYHINYKKTHYVYKWNTAYRKGYKFYHPKGYKWVWF